MRLISLELESKLREKGLWPQSWSAWAALYVLVLDLLLFVAQWLTRRASPATSASLGGWVVFLSVLAIVLLALTAYRWLRSQLLWRLRNRLIVTYVFIGVIPVFPIGLGSFSQCARHRFARAYRLPVAALATALAAAKPVDRHLCLYRRDSSFSAGDDLGDHALSFCLAVHRFCRDL